MAAVTSNRRWLFVLATSLGVFVIGTATAFACVVTQGKMTIDDGTGAPPTQSNGTISNAVEVHGDNSGFMLWCNDPITAEATSAGAWLDVSVGTTGSGCGSSSQPLPAGQYAVSFTNDAFDNATTSRAGTNNYSDSDLQTGLPSRDCMAMPPTGAPQPMPGSPTNTLLGTFTVNSSGTGSGTFQVPENALATDGSSVFSSSVAAGICVTKMDPLNYTGVPFHGFHNQGDGPPIGNFAPVNIS